MQCVGTWVVNAVSVNGFSLSSLLFNIFERDKGVKLVGYDFYCVKKLHILITKGFSVFFFWNAVKDGDVDVLKMALFAKLTLVGTKEFYMQF